LHLDYPTVEREREIVLTKVEGIEESLADQVVRTVKLIRVLELKKAPSVSETLDWARTLVLLGVSHLDTATARETLHVLLKHSGDIDRAAKELVAVRE
jgi:MoxR-like ATPase